MKDVASKAELNQVINSPVALIKFTATWCGPCKAVAPKIDQLAAQYPAVQCASVDIDKAQALARDFSVSAVPTFIFFKNGKQVETIKGANVGAVASAFAKYSSGATASVPKVGGNVLGSTTAQRSGQPVMGNQVINWVVLYFKTLFSLDARGAAAAA